ncbi:uncharacterized protein K444DRAFT_149843 [Hyaloscypha bicolor E]|uniref:Uncharacterized protein n=1 Tax=Hyaloscypha bicolor E TaxID=1095630 RepID=A0A2J6SRY7_9HELO|nr:uncharacterized protein K444DRAFT_149843 [Hyaloscypha bicolor E]PMD53544.1 hypothetical protein K444DRAFT_149843 [Hyaloscypha bicolor E]
MFHVTKGHTMFSRVKFCFISLHCPCTFDSPHIIALLLLTSLHCCLSAFMLNIQPSGRIWCLLFVSEEITKEI